MRRQVVGSHGVVRSGSMPGKSLGSFYWALVQGWAEIVETCKCTEHRVSATASGKYSQTEGVSSRTITFAEKNTCGCRQQQVAARAS